MPDRLRGKVAVITGGATGIGKAIATLFAAEGAQVAICDRNSESLSQMAGSGETLTIPCDISGILWRR